MRVVGYCTVGNHVRYIEVTGSQLALAAARRRMPEGVCDSCRRDQEEERAKARERREP